MQSIYRQCTYSEDGNRCRGVAKGYPKVEVQGFTIMLDTCNSHRLLGMSLLEDLRGLT